MRIVNFLIKLMHCFFHEQIVRVGKIEASIMEEKRILDLFNKEMQFNYMRLREFLYKPVMYFPNDLANPTIGIAIDIIRETDIGQPCLVIHDFIDNEKKRFTGTPFRYHEKTLRSILKLDIYERLVVLYRSNPDLITYRHPECRIYLYEEILDSLKKHGFQKAIIEYEKRSQEY